MGRHRQHRPRQRCTTREPLPFLIRHLIARSGASAPKSLSDIQREEDQRAEDVTAVEAKAKAMLGTVLLQYRQAARDSPAAPISLELLRKILIQTKHDGFLSWFEKSRADAKERRSLGDPAAESEESIRRRIRVCSYTYGGQDLAHFFHYIDREKRGHLTEESFRRGIARCAQQPTRNSTPENLART